MRHKSYESVSYAYTYPSERHTFKAGKVHSDLSLRTCFAAVGQGITDFGDFISRNIKTILITILVIAGMICAALGAYFIFDYNASHTKALAINAEDSFDIDTLDALMKNFALEITDEVDENGLIADSDCSISAGLLSQPVEYQTYTVKSGDTLAGIIIRFYGKYDVSKIERIKQANNMKNADSISIGQELIIPMD